MDLRQLEYFVAVAEELSFTRAAARCRVAQSALSYQVARLERGQGVVLFERTSRAVRARPAGELLLPRARRILAGVDVASAELAAFAGRAHRAAAVGRGRQRRRPRRWSSGRLPRSTERHPGVQIAVEDTGSRHMAEQVRGGELDLAFVGLFADQVTGRAGASRRWPWSRWSPSSRGITRSPAAARSASTSWPGRADSSRCGRSRGCASRSTRRSPGPGSPRTVAFELDTSDASCGSSGSGSVSRSCRRRRPRHTRAGTETDTGTSRPCRSTTRRPATR